MKEQTEQNITKIDNSVCLFLNGFLLGYLLNEIMNKLNKIKTEQDYLTEEYQEEEKEKEKEIKEQQQKKNCNIKSIHFINHIQNNELFDEIFPDYPNIYKVQPNWLYLDKKRVIKIDLGVEIVDFLNKQINTSECFEYPVQDFINIKKEKENEDQEDQKDQEDQEDQEYLVTLDTELFKSFGDNYIYINYTFNDVDYINIYSLDNTILSTHFQYINKVKCYITCIINYINDNYMNEHNITEYYNCYSNNDPFLTPKQILLNYDKLNENLENVTLKIIYPWNTYKYKMNEKIIIN
jgi:hypothetical protein